MAKPDQPLISIIIPVYNAEAFIAETLASIQAQTYPHWEVVIVNDGSTDQTKQQIESAKIPVEQLQYLETANRGPGAARNLGIAKSHGQLIAFIDGDDTWEPSKLELQIGELTKGQYDIVFSNGYFIGNAGNNQFTTAIGSYSGAEMFKLLYQNNRIPLLSVLATKAAVLKAGGFKEDDQLGRRCEDYDLWLRMASARCSFLGMEQRLVGYRLHPAGASRQVLAMTEAELAVVKQYDQRMSQEEPELYRRRQGELLNRLAADAARAGNLALARQSLQELREYEKGPLISTKHLLLRLFGSIYGPLYYRILKRIY